MNISSGLDTFRQGYKQIDINRGYTPAKSKDRNHLLVNKICAPRENQVQLITNYHKRGNVMMGMLKIFWPILRQDPGLRRMVLYQAKVTAKHRIAIIYQLDPPLCLACQVLSGDCSVYGDCSACKYMIKTETFHDSTGMNEDCIVHSITFIGKTSLVIYYVTCPCGFIYVGLTDTSKISKQKSRLEL